MTAYTCEPWPEGTLCGVYDAWSGPVGHESARLAIKGEYEELELSTGYRDVRTCPEKAKKVIRSMCAKLSQEIYRKVYIASLSQDQGRTDKIYKFLIQAFRHGPLILDMLQPPICYGIFGLCRNVYNENHLLTELLRFLETPGSILVSRIGPKNDIITFLAPRSVDQLSEGDWVIYDEDHERTIVHPAERSWFLVDQPLEPKQENSNRGRGRWLRERMDEKTYEGM